MTTTRARNAAAELIERTGWVQGHRAANIGSRSGDCYCIWTSLCHVCLGMNSVQRIYLMQRAIEAMGFTDSENVFQWNDADERTKEEVLARLRAPSAARQEGARTP